MYGPVAYHGPKDTTGKCVVLARSEADHYMPPFQTICLISIGRSLRNPCGGFLDAAGPYPWRPLWASTRLHRYRMELPSFQQRVWIGVLKLLYAVVR